MATVQVYDLTTSQWTLDTALPAARYSHGAVVAAAGRLLVAGGYDAAGNASASVWQSQQLNAPETPPVFTSFPAMAGSLDSFYRYQVEAVGNPVATYSLVGAPSGMSIDPGSGLITWQPAVGQVGTHAVTVHAANRVGIADQMFDIVVVNDTIAPTAPTLLEVAAVTADSVDLAWSGAADENGVDYYGVYRKYRCGFRGIKRCYGLVQGNLPGETTTITGLDPLSSHTYVVRAFDADGNMSPNSVAVSFTTLSPPTNLRYAGATMLPANFPLQLQFYVSANPAATFSIVSGPPGLTLDEGTGVVDWTPTPSDVGIHPLQVMAENAGGTTFLSVDITVNPDAPQVSLQYVPGTGGYRDAVAGSPWSARVLDGSHTPSTFSLVAAPLGMTLDPMTGVLSWVPAPEDAGQASVTVRAVNAASTVEIRFEFYVHFTGPVSNILVTGLTDLEPTATWSPPTGIGSDRVAGYTIVARARYRYGRSWRTHSLTFETEGTDPSIVLSGLRVGKTYSLRIHAVDEVDHRGLIQTNDVSFASIPGIPVVSWSVSNVNGGGSVIAGQEAIVQVTSYDNGFGTPTYALVSGPVGLTLDPVTGEGRWTPTAADVGTVPVVIRATNDIGPRDVSIGIRVFFSGPVLNAYATRNGYSATAHWQPPSDNALPVVRYRVTIHWQWSSRRRSRETSATGTSLAFPLYPTGAVWHKGVKISPVDADGNYGVSTPLVPYNGALPSNLPYSDAVWIEGVTIDSNKVPVVEIRGEAGRTADLEVTENFVDWGVLESVVLDEDELIHCPDPDGALAPRGSYRLIIH